MIAAVDACCGAGGASEGLIAAGYAPVGYDNWQVAVDTSRANGHDAHLLNLSLLDPPTPDGPWLLWGSFPCQPFSAAGDGEGEFDGRDGLPWWLRMLDTMQPDVSIIENVKGLTFEKHAAYLGRTLGAARRLGYDLEWRVLNCADYGVPQTRERFICICRRDGGRIAWPTVTHTREAGLFTERWVSMADALGWDSNREDQRPGHSNLLVTERQANSARRTWDEPAPTITAAMDNGNLRRMVDTRTMNGIIDAEAGPAPTVPGQWVLDRRQSPSAGAPHVPRDRPAPTVLASSGSQNSWHWTHDRPATSVNGDVRVSAPGRHDPDQSGSQQADAIPVTIPELARLQDFPDGYQFCGNKTDQARQIGNACPRTLARVLAAANRPEGT
jgi:DNA (cytosine-5)-methyltransferase 1